MLSTVLHHPQREREVSQSLDTVKRAAHILTVSTTYGAFTEHRIKRHGFDLIH